MTDLTEYLKAAKSPYHAVLFAEDRLREAGFEKLDLTDKFELKAGGKYFLIPYPRALFAFRISDKATGSGIHIACAHTDSPTFRLKPMPDMDAKGGIRRINVEPYGGMLKKTWFDRSLGVAGLLFVKGENAYSPRPVLFDSGEPWFVIPSLAPHMDREIEEKKLDAQKELIPLFGLSSDEKLKFTDALAKKAGVRAEDILDYDLELYLNEEPVYCGPGKDLLLAARIDNIASVAALTEGIIAAGSGADSNDISMIALFDNEEIGSRTKQGADSNIVNMIIDRIFESDLYSGSSKTTAIASGRILSVDGAHGVHPNYPEKADETAKVYLGKGVVLKSSASQRYVTDPEMGAVLSAICSENGIALQRQANRSGAPGGQTLGPIISAYLPIPAADVGIPMLAMHSAKETMCVSDYEMLKKLAEKFLAL